MERTKFDRQPYESAESYDMRLKDIGCDVNSTLDQLGHKYGTDKRSNGCHNYLKYYEMFFAERRLDYINFLEIGCWHGDSLRTWEEYFPNAKIVSIDIDDMRQYETDRIKTLICNQNNVEGLKEYFSDFTLDIVVDDGGHRGDDQIISFTTLFPLMRSGGLYCIEDLLCSYHHWADKDSFISYIKRYLVDAVQMNGVIPHDKLCSDKREQVKLYDVDYFAKNIEWIWLGMGLVIIKKL